MQMPSLMFLSPFCHLLFNWVNGVFYMNLCVNCVCAHEVKS